MQPERYDYREVVCPACGAVMGAYCKRPSGHSGPFVAPHQQRQQAAHVVWRAEELRLYGRIITTWDDDPAPTTSPPVEQGQQLSLFA